MNSRVLSKQQQKTPLWLVVLVTVALLFTLTSVGGFVYKKWFAPISQQKHQSALIIEQQLILNQSDVVKTNWLRTLDPLVKEVEGGIVWSNTLQKGVMEFNGLPKIASNQQYQLWIYDLVGEDAEPVFAIEFNEVNIGNFLKSFSAKQEILAPFKFELMLKTDGEESSQPLFLAQP